MPKAKSGLEPKILHPMKAFATVNAHSEGIRINRLEDRRIPLVPFPHKHDFYHLLLITEGKGWHEIDFERYDFGPGSFFIMRPAQVHSWSLSPNCKGFIIEFEAKILASKDIRWGQLPAVLHHLPEYSQLHRHQRAEIESLAQKAREEYERKLPGFEIILLSKLAELIIQLSRFAKDSPQALWASNPLHNRFLELLENHFKEQHSVEFYASQLQLSPKALTMRFYRDQLHNPRSIIQQRCLLEAKRLLAYSNLSISEIADSLGFEDPNYFSRFFRKQTGKAPGKFRKAP